MPLIEVDDAVLEALRTNNIKHADASAKLKQAADYEAAFRKLSAGDTAEDFWSLYKKAYPDAYVPQVDAAKPLKDEIAALKEQMAADKKEREEREAAREKETREAAASDTVAKGRTWLRRSKQMDDDGVKAVEAIMQEVGIPSYEVAFNHWKAQQPADAAPVDLPSVHAARSLDWFTPADDAPDHKLLLKDPLAYRAKRTNEILSKVRAGLMDEFGRPINRAA